MSLHDSKTARKNQALSVGKYKTLCYLFYYTLLLASNAACAGLRLTASAK